MKKKPRFYLFVSFGLLTILLLSNLFISIFLAKKSLDYLKDFQFQKAQKTAQLGARLINPIVSLSFNKNKLINSTAGVLYLVNDVSSVAENLLKQDNLNELDLNLLLRKVPKIVDDVSLIDPSLTQTEKLKTYQKDLPFSPSQLLSFVHDNASQLKEIANNLLKNNSTWLVVFQNSNELRPTGGFMGSYALVTLDNGKLNSIKVEDIYDADGQFQGFIDPPTGVKEYLSADKGLRLPDSNWSPDFPQSAQQALAYFALGKRNQIEGVIFIDNNLVKKLLKLTGPIYIPDYQKTITADNFDDQLQNRGQFFPGSQTKKHLLSLVLNQLMLKLPQTIKAQPLKFSRLLTEAAQEKNIQAFSLNFAWQKIFNQLHLTNQLKDHSLCLDLALIEANVGINKINPYVDREVFLNLNDQDEPSLEVNVNFTNQAKKAKNGQNEYVNYQRIFVEPSWQLENVVINGQPVWQVDNEIIQTESQDQFRQVGFLVVVKPESRSEVKVRFVGGDIPPSLCLFKQPGLPPISYTINANLDEKEGFKVVKLDQDKRINLTN